MEKRLEQMEEFLVGLIAREGADKGHGRGVRVLLGLLRQMSHAYRAVVVMRLFLYRKGIFRHQTLGCQVISVGNLTVGGTGKTPVVEIFARELQREGRRVAILSRGYKREQPPLGKQIVNRLLLREQRHPPRVVSDGQTLLLDSARSGDEPYMLASNLPDVAVLVGKDRVRSGKYAINRLGCDTLILDDGFQYLDLKHRVEIVLIDRTNPFGNGNVLPRGILREPVSSISRADFIFITKSNGTGNEALREQIRTLNTDAEIIECRHAARHLRHVFTSERQELGFLKGRRVVALSGIAAPTGFENELKQRGSELVGTHRFADHHRYSQQELIDIINDAKQNEADAIVTTEKDAVRFPRLDRCDVPIYFLRVDIEILSGAEDFQECISRICFRERAET